MSELRSEGEPRGGRGFLGRAGSERSLNVRCLIIIMVVVVLTALAGWGMGLWAALFGP